MENKLPIGIESFEKIRTQGFYYVDKTALLKELLENWGEVNLFTRPRRFGKSLNMSMLKCFFEIGQDNTLFDGLEIAKERELCEAYQGQFPVISITLKGVRAFVYENARAMMVSLINMEARRLQYLLDSDQLSLYDKHAFKALLQKEMTDAILNDSLLILSQLLHKHYNRKVIILIDEYDVPLDKAFQFGYYDQMIHLIRNIFNQALKSNESLYFAVLTGCLRVSKESIFTGLNNPKILSITDMRFEEYFGFTDLEVKQLFSYYGLDEYLNIVKQWYDGYQFGKAEIYCPWDVINYCDQLRTDKSASPQDYWSHTSDNDLVRRFVKKATKYTQNEIEKLIAGETVVKPIRQELTYNELDSSIDHLWSVLFTTGYLTQRGKVGEEQYRLAIPNKEIRKIFVTQVQEWFQEAARLDTPKLDAFCAAFPRGDTKGIEELFNSYLRRTISIRDTGVRKEKKENFYHGILLGLLSHKEDWGIFSNAEAGDGYSDILVEIDTEQIGIVIEIKYAEENAFDAGCAEALKQIEQKRYAERLLEDGMEKIIKYGIACCKKRCRVMIG